jgi:hypothetical protein
MIVVGRTIGGCTLNGLEYLLDDEGEEIRFETEESAREFLSEHGIDEQYHDDFYFEEISE